MKTYSLQDLYKESCLKQEVWERVVREDSGASKILLYKRVYEQYFAHPSTIIFQNPTTESHFHVLCSHLRTKKQKHGWEVIGEWGTWASIICKGLTAECRATLEGSTHCVLAPEKHLRSSALKSCYEFESILNLSYSIQGTNLILSGTGFEHRIFHWEKYF